MGDSIKMAGIFSYEPTPFANNTVKQQTLVRSNMICPVCRKTFDIILATSIVDPKQMFMCSECKTQFNFYSYQLLYSSYIMQRAETAKTLVNNETQKTIPIEPIINETMKEQLTRVNSQTLSVDQILQKNATATKQIPKLETKPLDLSPPDMSRPPMTLKDFNSIIDFEDIKTVLTDVVNNKSIVHVCMLGPPGQGKTVFLKVIERYYGNKCMMVSGQSVTKSGLTDKVLKNPMLEAVLIDEIDKMEIEDQMPLLSIMSDNRVNELKFRRDRSAEDLKIKIFATGNDYNKIYPALVDRFFFIHQEKYTPEQFYKIGKSILHAKFGTKFTDELINYMIDKFYNSMKKVSMRDLVDKVAKICRPDKKSIDFYVSTLNKYTQ